MAKYCPLAKRKVVYLDCLECEEKECEKKDNSKYIDKEKNEKDEKDGEGK